MVRKLTPARVDGHAPRRPVEVTEREGPAHFRPAVQLVAAMHL